ncbi:uncharacterized protein TNCV_4590161 [Trichonephila clavipes]|nr:uncharacterized protein TNCV_4590161 [Trichonephila clavipes]
MADVQDLKSALLYALKLEANEASCRDLHFIRGTRMNADAPCESPWIKEIEKLRDKIQDLMAQRQKLRRRGITCWGCGGAGIIESNKVCSHRKRSADTIGDVPLRKPCPENRKYHCSRVGKKFFVKDLIVRQVTTPSTSALDPWNDESIRKDQLADPEIKPII